MGNLAAMSAAANWSILRPPHFLHELMSKESERRERVERRRIAREKGICARCFDKPTTLNQDGATKSIYCDGCRPARKMRVNERDVQNPRPKKYDEDEPHFTETREFKVYALRIACFIKRSDTSESVNYKGVTIGDIHRELGDEHRAWTLDALNEIHTYRKWMIPERYTLRPPTVRSIPLSEAKPFQPPPRRYKANEQPAGLGLPQRATI